jgi:hypothetical protein
MPTPVEVCFLIDEAGAVLWRDRSTSPSALPDSTERWRAVWRHREMLSVIAHSHPRGPLAFSSEDRTTMEAIDSGLGRPLRYAVVTADGLIYRDADGTDRIATDHPTWVATLREESGMTTD